MLNLGVPYKVRVAAGSQSVQVRFLPTHALHNQVGLRVAICIDGNNPEVYSIDTKEFSKTWSKNVLQGFAEVSLPIIAGDHSLRIYLLDPGLVLTAVRVSSQPPIKQE